jgi:anti-anti-sigma factor
MARPVAVDTWWNGDHIAFHLALRYSGREVVVEPVGEVDVLTGPALGGLLGALIDEGQTEIVLDLANVDFMGAAGLGVIAVMSSRLRSSGRSFSIRSPSPMIRKVLDISGMTGLMDHEASKTAPAEPEELHTDRGSVPSAPDVPKVSPLPVSTGLVDAALRLVTAMARATVGGADGVSVAVTRQGQLTTVAASDEIIAQMDRDQYATGEGPCMAAAEGGRSFHVESVDEEVRWPRFIPRARHDGIASILSPPLMVSERPVGSLNIYSNTERAFKEHDRELAALFASEASAILAEARAETSIDAIAKRLRDSLSAREIIAQAQGVIMARQGISAEAAYANLRQSSKRSANTIRECAEALVSSTTRGDLIGQVGT